MDSPGFELSASRLLYRGPDGIGGRTGAGHRTVNPLPGKSAGYGLGG